MLREVKDLVHLLLVTKWQRQKCRPCLSGSQSHSSALTPPSSLFWTAKIMWNWQNNLKKEIFFLNSLILRGTALQPPKWYLLTTLVHLPFILMYQMPSPYHSFQSMAPTQLTKDMARSSKNNTRICTLVTFSTFDLLRGNLIEFCIMAHAHTSKRMKNNQRNYNA